jgi:DNA-directed RNA polymerase subunit F
MKIISKRPVCLGEVKEILGKKEKEENQRIEMMREYLNNFLKITPENAKKLKEEIKALNIPKIDEEHMVKIIDIMPIDADDVKKIFFGTSVALTQDEIQKILDVVKKYRK